MSCLRARNPRDVWERMGVSWKTSTLYFPGRCHLQGRAGEAGTHATWIRKSQYAEFRASSVHDFEENAQETLDRKNDFSTDQSPARDLRVYHRFSFIVFCHDIDRSTVGEMRASWQRLDRATAAHAHVSTWAIALDRHHHFLDRAAFG